MFERCFKLSSREILRSPTLLAQQSQPAARLFLPLKLGSRSNRLFQSRARCLGLAHHVLCHPKMKLNLRVIGTLGRTLIKQIDSLLVPALFISNPAQRIEDGWISWCNRAGLLRELGGAIQIVELLRVN